jgi:hypothetical protein
MNSSGIVPSLCLTHCQQHCQQHRQRQDSLQAQGW